MFVKFFSVYFLLCCVCFCTDHIDMLPFILTHTALSVWNIFSLNNSSIYIKHANNLLDGVMLIYNSTLAI